MTTLALPTARHRRPWATATGFLLRRFLTVALWFWGALTLVAVALPLILAGFGVTGVPILGITWQAGVWFAFSLMVSGAAAYLPVHVAFGMTRRSYWRASLTATLGLGAALAAFQVVGLLLQGWWFSAMGWRAEVIDSLQVTDAALGGHPLAYLLLYTGGGLSGLLVGAAYARLRAWGGTLTLPLTVGPLVVVGAVLADVGQGSLLGVLGTTAATAHWLAPVIVTTASVAMALAFVLLVRAQRITAPPRAS